MVVSGKKFGAYGAPLPLGRITVHQETYPDEGIWDVVVLHGFHLLFSGCCCVGCCGFGRCFPRHFPLGCFCLWTRELVSPFRSESFSGGDPLRFIGGEATGPAWSGRGLWPHRNGCAIGFACLSLLGTADSRVVYWSGFPYTLVLICTFIIFKLTGRLFGKRESLDKISQMRDAQQTF